MSETPTYREELPSDPAYDAFTPHPVPALWGYKDLLVFIAFSAIAFGFSAAAVLLGVKALEAITGSAIPIHEGPYQLPVVLTIQFLWWAIVLGYIYRLVTEKYQLPFAEAIGWKPFNGPGLNYLSAGVLVALSVGLLSNIVPMPEQQVPIEELLQQPGALLLFAIFGVLVAPAIEELVFRGFLFPAIERKHGQLVAILATSALFSGLHFSQYGGHWAILLLLFYVGAVFGFVRARTGSIKATTILHAAYNATFLVGLHFAQQQGLTS
ncbi:MAG: CPBP family intramembrane metalloprotease [Bryobacterales bacterium]|nr:CPBP family intramembrane metalloprotease [Bryobacterales bacterium]